MERIFSNIQDIFINHSFFNNWPNWLVYLSYVLLVGLGVFVLYLLVSFLLTPLMWLYNKLTDKNTSNVPQEKDYLLGELTEKISGKGIGEVMETGNGGSRSSHPARLYKESEVAANEVYSVGTKVLIIDFDEQGIALVVRNQNFI